MLACSILCALGTWQLKRLAWKQELIATIEQRATQVPVEIGDVAEPRSAQEWQRVRARGEFAVGEHFMISPRTMEGKVGFHLFDVLRLADGTKIAVNRGFVAMRNPNASEDFDPPPTGTVTVEGVLRVPARTGFTPENNPTRAEWYWADLKAMLKSDDAISDVYIQQTATSSTPGYPVALLVSPELPNNHAQYAAFWFSMAGLCVLVFVLARRKGYA